MYRYKALKIKGKRIDEHRLVMQQFLGRVLRTEEIIHHKDGDGRNNAIENLQIMTRSEHSRYHTTKRGNDHLKHPAPCGTASGYRRGCRCDLCKKHNAKRMRDYLRRKKLKALEEEEKLNNLLF